MIRKNGAQQWRNIHLTKEAQLDDLIDIDNSAASGPQPTGLALLKQAASALDTLLQEARRRGTRIRGLGSGWALTDIAITDGWLINTKLLNGCFDVGDDLFAPGYAPEKRPYVVVAQCGISINELNIQLETTGRALKTAGIGAGQTLAGAISGNTHGSAINFGAMSDFVVGLQLVTGSGKSLWIERASHPVMNDDFITRLDSTRLQDDDVFYAAVVSFGAFGIITAVAIETSPIYQLKFPPVRDIAYEDLKAKLAQDDFPDLYHYEFIFDPYNPAELAMEASATKVAVEAGPPPRAAVWIVRNENGFAPGDKAAALFYDLPLLPPGAKTKIQFDAYRKLCILGDVRGTPGQLFTATITYLEGYTESAFGVAITHADRMIDISSRVIKALQLPAMSQVRLVKASSALLSFTHLEPRTAVFEFGMANNATFPQFEEELAKALTAEGIPYTLHWSKNSGLDPQRLASMYGTARIATWRQARARVFQNDAVLMAVFDNEHLRRSGLIEGIGSRPKA